MKFLSLSLSLVALPMCLAADNSSKLTGKSVLVMPQRASDACTNSCDLQTLIMNQHPEKIPPFLQSCKSFSEELAKAFAIGLYLGKHPEIFCMSRDSSQKKTRTLLVSSDELMNVISDKTNWESNPFEKLFDLECLNSAPSLKKPNLEFSEFRSMFAECALNAEAMIAVDVAILKWFAQEIHMIPDDVLEIDQFLLQSVVALSMDPQIGKFLMEDILNVVEQIKHWSNQEYYSSFWGRVYFSSLLTLLKFLDDDSLIRSNIVAVTAKMYVNGEATCAESRLILGPNHPFVVSMEKDASKEKLDKCDAQLQIQANCDRKLHSLCDGSSPNFKVDCLFLSKSNPSYVLSAIIEKDGLKWNGTDFTAFRYILFDNHPPEHKQNSLFMLGKVRPPAIFSQRVVSSTSLREMYLILEESEMKRLILTYGITILESSSLCGVN